MLRNNVVATTKKLCANLDSSCRENSTQNKCGQATNMGDRKSLKFVRTNLFEYQMLRKSRFRAQHTAADKAQRNGNADKHNGMIKGAIVGQYCPCETHCENSVTHCRVTIEYESKPNPRTNKYESPKKSFLSTTDRPQLIRQRSVSGKKSNHEPRKETRGAQHKPDVKTQAHTKHTCLTDTTVSTSARPFLQRHRFQLRLKHRRLGDSEGQGSTSAALKQVLEKTEGDTKSLDKEASTDGMTLLLRTKSRSHLITVWLMCSLNCTAAFARVICGMWSDSAVRGNLGRGVWL